jgi:AcrR family transcriptional regulator
MTSIISAPFDVIANRSIARRNKTGARTVPPHFSRWRTAIARRARINERMIFYCFDSKEGIYRAVLTHRLSAKACLIESTTDGDFTSSLVKGFAATCADIDVLRMWLSEALDRSTANWLRARSGKPTSRPRLPAGGAQRLADTYRATQTKRCCSS